MKAFTAITFTACLIIVDAAIYFTRIPNKTDCLIVYTKGNYSSGTVYKFGDMYHIQNDRPYYLTQYEVGAADGCTMHSDTVTSSLWNTQACYAFKAFNAIKG